MIFKDIFSRHKLTIILIVIAYFVVASSKKVRVKQGPGGMSYEDSTNCSEFSKFARFNPYSVIQERWFVFYYWAPVRSPATYVFTVPSASHIKRLKRVFDGNCVLPVIWDARLLLMEDDRKHLHLLVERSDRGEYWQYPVVKEITPTKITPRDVRLKQTGDNRVLGILDCVDDTFLVMSRLNDVPRKGKLHEVASRLGYRGRKGKSYLYQGHEWGPVGEADENHYWDRRTKKVRDRTSTEAKSSETNSEETESIPMQTNEHENSEGKKTKRKKGTTVAPVKPEDDETCVKVVPELWNDPPPNPNPHNLLTSDELKELDTEDDTKDTSPVDGPDSSNDKNNKETKQESNIHEEPEMARVKRDNHKIVHTIGTPLTTYQKLQMKLENDKKLDDIRKQEKKLENIQRNLKKSKNTPGNDNKSKSIPENHEKSESTPKNNNKSEKQTETEKKSENTLKNYKKSENISESDKKYENKPENDIKSGNTLDNDKKTESKPENVKKLANTLENDKKSESTQENDNKLESMLKNDNNLANTPENDNKPGNILGDFLNPENTPENFEPHNHKVCSATADPDEDESCVVCFKSQVNYVSEDPYIPDSARSMPSLKDNEEVPTKEVPHLEEPVFKISGVETPRTEVPPKGLSAKPPRAEIPRKKEPVGKPKPTAEQTNSSEFIVLAPKKIEDLKS